MKMHVSEQQSVAAIINELTRVPERIIELVFPESAAFFDDPENLQLLKNQGILLSKKITIISKSDEHIALARKVGLEAQLLSDAASTTPEDEEPDHEIEHDFLSAQESERSADFTKRYFDLGKQRSTEVQPVELPSEETPIQINHEEDPLFSHPSQAAQTIEEFEQKKVEDRLPIEEELEEVEQKNRKGLYIKAAILVVFFAILGFLYIYLPQATLQLTAKRDRIAFSFDAFAQKDISTVDLEKRLIPVQSVEITKELSQPFEVKKKGSSTSKAKGRITVYNQLTNPQFMIPSRFQAESGTIYWSQRNISIPAKGSLEIEVVADKAGPSSNLTCSIEKPCSFTIPAWKDTDNYTKVFAKSTQSLTGGSSGQGYIVSEEEYQAAQTALRNELLAQAQKEFASKIPKELSLLEDSVRSELVSISSDPSVDGISQDGKATIKGKMLLQAYAIKEQDLKDLIHTLVRNQLDNEREAKPESVKLEYKVLSADQKTGKVTLSVSASEEVAYKISSEELKTSLSGKSESEVRSILEALPKVQSAHITLWPFWVRTIPQRQDRIRIEIQ